jgi:acetyltransferase-like isoleucine patch superfamily enzyme
MYSKQNIYYELQPGKSIPGDWHNFPIPHNIEVGINSVIDSSSCFKKFSSELPIGLKIGNHVTLQSPAFGIEKNGYVEIGDYSYISSATIAAFEKIIIGKYVFIAGGVTIVDTDFHPLDPALRLYDTVAISPIGDKSRRPHFETRPVIIEDGVWIGYNATILKGVTIGSDSVIQPGALVTKNIPANSFVSGNPAIIETVDHA